MRISIIRYLTYTLILPIILFLILFSDSRNRVTPTFVSDMSLILIFFIPLLATYLIAKVQLKRVNTQVKKQPKPIARTIVLLLVTIFLTLFTGIMHEIIASSYWGRENWYFDGYVWLIIFTTLVAMIYNPIAVFLVIYLSKREVLNNSK